jgi:hypothetical protein
MNHASGESAAGAGATAATRSSISIIRIFKTPQQLV